MACGAAGGCPAGANWWELNTASEIDWPQQSRLIELMDNADGTLSIFGTLLDHSATYEVPAAGSATGFTVDQLGAISRTLSYNDPQATLGATGLRRTATSSCSSTTRADHFRSPARRSCGRADVG